MLIADPREADRELERNARPPGWRNPQPRERYDLVVIGAGPAGLTAALDAAREGRTVALVERRMLGGNSLHSGAVPAASLLRTARWYADQRDAERFGGVAPDPAPPDFGVALARMRTVRARLSRRWKAEDLRAFGIDLFFGQARFSGPAAMRVAGRTVAFGKALIATGAKPRPVAIPGLAADRCHTVDSIFDLDRRPERMVVFGTYGVVFAHLFQPLGVKVLVVQDDPKFLSFIERDAAQIMARSLARLGAEIHLDTVVKAVRDKGASFEIDLSNRRDYTVSATDILAADMPAPAVGGLGLEAAGVAFSEADGIRVDDTMRTTNPDIYAAGDVCARFHFVHLAEAQARLAVRNALFGGDEKASALVVPLCAYTNPGIAHVGMLVPEARDRSIPVKTITVLLHDVDRAIVDGEEEGFLKIHVRDGTDEILGATSVGQHAGELIGGVAVAMRFKSGLSRFSDITLAYPMLGEAVKTASETLNHSATLSVASDSALET